MQKVATPGQATCEEVAALLNLPLSRTVKCLMIFAQDKVQMLLVRGDHSGNEVKIGKLPNLGPWRWANDVEIFAAAGCNPGYLGPVGIPSTMPLIVDRSVAVMSDFVCGANERDFHLRGVNFGRDCREADLIADIRNVVDGDPSPDGKGTLEILRGIEVGHVFALGNVYSSALGATYLDAAGQSQVMEMGCYGIGITRVVAAAIEQNNDAKGIIWPDALAPFTVAIAPIGYDRNEAVRFAADRLHDELGAAGVEVLLDDRGERPGVMFADLELIGVPHRITIGERALKEGNVEYQDRRDGGRRPSRWLALWIGSAVALRDHRAAKLAGCEFRENGVATNSDTGGMRGVGVFDRPAVCIRRRSSRGAARAVGRRRSRAVDCR
jgi:prolyl-tRNA synthetase